MPEEKELLDVLVNGVKVDVPSREISSRELLELAKERKAMPGSVEEYILFGNEGPYEPGALVDVKKDDALLTVPSGPTLVA